MVDNYFKIQHKVKDFECDLTGKMKFPSLMTHLVYTSGEQTAAIIDEIGQDRIGDANLTWILIRYEADIQRLPEAGEELTLATESISYNKLFAYRHFDAMDASGERIVHVQTVFALMDMEERKIVRLEEKFLEGYSLKEPKSNRLKRYPDPRGIDEGEDYRDREYFVRFYDIDGNQHVNNTLYVTWAIDVLGADFLTQYDLRHLIIKFDKEVYYGDSVLSKASIYQADDESTHSFHRIETEKKLNAELELTWQKKS